jgi:hypothetical protein
MRIQIDPFQFLQELVTVHQGILPTRGLQVLTGSFNWCHSTLIEEMFLVVENFALKFLLILDGEIQSFLHKTEKIRSPDMSLCEVFTPSMLSCCSFLAFF